MMPVISTKSVGPKRLKALGPGSLLSIYATLMGTVNWTALT